MTVHPGLEIDNDLLAHFRAGFDRRRAQVGQQDSVGQVQKLGIDGGLELEDVEARSGRKQMISGGRVGAVDRDDVHSGQHLIQTFPVGRFKLFGNARTDRLTVVIVDLHAEGLGAPGDGLTDSAHADNAQALA